MKRMVWSWCCLLCLSQSVAAGPLLERWRERQSESGFTEAEAGFRPGETTRVLRDLAYGSDGRQRLDVYLPRQPLQGAPLILMVHGGAWRIGDKNSRGVVENKMRHWLARGYIFISANYRLLPQAQPVEQAGDVARALAYVQQQAAGWGGDPGRVVLMGHSAGAHLVALLSAAPELTRPHGVAPWLGTVALDSAAYDLVQIMEQPHYRFYDQAFGSDPAYWKAASPLYRLQQAGPPLLAVCSSQRPDHPCAQARAFAARGRGQGMQVEVLEQPLSHGDINKNLGLEGDYTRAVDRFLAGLGLAQ